MKVHFSTQSQKDISYFKKNNQTLFKKICFLLLDIEENPFSGIGKPEPLKHELKSLWSRRINKQHRLVYQIKDDEIIIHSCRFHY